MSRVTEFSELTVDELQARQRDLRQEYLHLRLQQQSGQLKKPSRLNEIRKDVARIQTVLSHRRTGVKVAYKAKAKKS